MGIRTFTFVVALLYAAILVSGQNNCGNAGPGLSAVAFETSTGAPATLLLNTNSTSSYDSWYSFSIQTWIYLDPVNGLNTERPIAVKAPRILGNGGSYSNGLVPAQEFSLEVTPRGGLRFRMGCISSLGFDAETVSTLSTGNWINVAVSMNADIPAAYLYINGTRQALTSGGNVATWSQTCANSQSGLTGPYRSTAPGATTTTPRVLGNNIQIGSYSVLLAAAPYRFFGSIDEFSVWNRSISDSEVVSNAANALRGDENGLLSYHNFNEGTGTVVTSPFPLTGPSRIAGPSAPTVNGYLLNGVTFRGSGVALNYAPISSNPNVNVTIFGINTPNRNGTIYYVLTVLPTRGYLTGFVGRPSSPNPSTLRLYDTLTTADGSFPVVSYFADAGFSGTDSFSFTAYASVDSNGNFVTCTPATSIGSTVFLVVGNASPSPSPRPSTTPSDCNDNYDPCGVLYGDGSSCAGCDGIPYSNTVYDSCGVCGGTNECLDCNGVPYGPTPKTECGCCPNVINSNGTTTYVCPDGGSNITFCIDCNGCPFGSAIVDACGVCNGDGTSCLGCDGRINGPTLDLCGRCNTGNLAAFERDQACGVPQCNNDPNIVPDECGVCGGDGSTCQCRFYQNYEVSKLDCALIGFTLNHTLCIIDELLAELELSYQNINNFTQSNTVANYNALYQNEIIALTRFLSPVTSTSDSSVGCLSEFCGQISSAIAAVSEYVSE